MSIDLSQLSFPELLALQRALTAEIPKRSNVEKMKLIHELELLASARGFALKDLIGTEQVKLPSAARYRSRDGLEWSGRGRKLGWVVEHLAHGGELADLAV